MLSLCSLVIEKAGRTLFDPLTFSFGTCRQALVGASGVGKSSLARVLAGLEEPTSGSVAAQEPVRYLPQTESRPDETVDSHLADLWSTDAPSNRLWYRLLPNVDYDAPLTQLSGGEWMRLRLMRLLGDPGAFIILDEPTNHLDHEGRAMVAEFIRSRDGNLIVISHDRMLLREVDEVVELTPLGLQRFGGAFDAYWEERTAQRARQEAHLDAASRRKKLLQAKAAEKLAKQDKRSRSAARKAPDAGLPKVVIGGLKRQAEGTRGRLVSRAEKELEAATEEIRSALDARQADPFLRLDFEAEAPPAGALHARFSEVRFRFSTTGKELWPNPLSFEMKGRERWRLRGLNGSGKSTLLQLLRGESIGIVEGERYLSGRSLAYLDQHQSFLPGEKGLIEVLLPASRFPQVELRNELAFYGFTGDKVFQRIDTLSGGERLRAALAAMFLGPEIPQIVLLDEPTNNLDFQSQELLQQAVARFAGLLVVASHDEDFVGGLQIDHELVLQRG